MTVRQHPMTTQQRPGNRLLTRAARIAESSKQVSEGAFTHIGRDRPHSKEAARRVFSSQSDGEWITISKRRHAMHLFLSPIFALGGIWIGGGSVGLVIVIVIVVLLLRR